ncbi:hypothetical protein K4K61_003405 [Colletotrichum sp. SAR11_59]|nr:hypothetical protein K4K61_003405 [Colletotrichum sp. SAR11_59]
MAQLLILGSQKKSHSGSVLLFVRVLASVYAAPFEALYFYYAYRMEYDAVAADSTLTIDDMWLAPYCNPGDGSRRACNFNEFVHSVYDDLDGYTGAIDPDAYTRDTPLATIAEDLHNAGFQRVHLDPTSLVKDLTVYNTLYYKVIKKVTDSVQWSRSKGSTADLDRAREAISGVYGERKADNMFDTMEDNLMAKHGNDFVAVQEILDQATNLISEYETAKTRASDHYLKTYGDGESSVEFDNTGNGPLNVPGFPLAVSIERSHDERFAHGFNDWAQDRLTAREIAMISLINDITDKSGWLKDMFNDVKIASWRAEALTRPLMSPLAWNWCLLELRDMAKDANERGHICVLNTASRATNRFGLARLPIWSRPEHVSLDVKITSYINNLHPAAHKSLYSTIEQFISLSIQPWNDVLAYRDRGLCPSRIKTSGVVWWPSFPDWAAGLNKIEKDRTTEEYREAKKKVEEYLTVPELPPSLQQNMTSRVGLPTIEEDWEDLGLGWAVRVKHERLKHWLHPEPGISFTYDNWKQGKTGKSLVRGRIPKKPLPESVSGLSPLEPGPGHQFYGVSLKDRFLKQGLQVIVQISTVELTPENPAQPPTDWHLNGMGNEHIVATSLVYFDSINITETSGAISFRVEADLDADAHVYRRGDLAPLAGIYGLADPGQLHGDSEEPNALQELGTIVAPDGRLVAYPNTLQHRVEAYELLDRSRPGRRRCLTMHLVDPHYRICSTRNVPPQQHDWWVEEGPAKIDWAGHHVPQEIINRIMTEVGEWPIGMEEASRVRDEVINEHLAGMEAVQDKVMRYQFD